jgi:hypothetical protein
MAYSILARLDSVASSLGLLRESARMKKGNNPWGYAGGRSDKQEPKGLEMGEKPSYSRASSMESVGSGVSLKGRF